MSHAKILSQVPSRQFPLAALRWWVINTCWRGGGDIYHNLLFVSVTVVSITNIVSLKETAITSRLSINELYENIIITFREAYQTSPGSTLLSLLKRVQLFKLCTFFPSVCTCVPFHTSATTMFFSVETIEIKKHQFK